MSYIDLITRIKNAQMAGHPNLKVPYSRMNESISNLLSSNGYIKKFDVKGRGSQKVIKITLDSNNSIEGVEFMSKPSRRLYSGYEDLRSVKGGHGTLVISTPKGILSGQDAKQQKVGGQLLFKIW